MPRVVRAARLQNCRDVSPGRGLAPRKEVETIESTLTMVVLLLLILWITRR
jgi:hypothetical protein